MFSPSMSLFLNPGSYSYSKNKVKETFIPAINYRIFSIAQSHYSVILSLEKIFLKHELILQVCVNMMGD